MNPVTNGFVQLYDLGVYGFTIGDASGNNYCTDSFGPKEYDWECSYYSTASAGETFSYRLLEKQYATSYAGEGFSFSISADDFSNFDSQFGFSYAIIAGTCDSNPSDVDADCTWNQPSGGTGTDDTLEFYGLQEDWDPYAVLFDPITQSYEVFVFFPSSVVSGEYYKLITYNYDHWNSEVESNSYLITVLEHPTPDGTNLYDIFGSPNCEMSTCFYQSSQSDFDTYADDLI